jgi:hypothetical protein
MYFQGDSEITVKPVTRRATMARGTFHKRERRYLMKAGRKPLNRHAYPTMGTPVAVDLSMQPGHFGGEPADAFSMKGLNPLRPASAGPIILAVQTRSGRRVLTRPYDPFSPVALGASILDPLSVMPVFVPSMSAAPTPAPTGGFWNPLSNLVELWNQRPQVLKNIRIKVAPQQVMSMAQSVVKPSQVSGAVDQLRAWGVNLDYQGVPISGTTAGAGYRIAGMDLGQYLPWIAGGAALLFVVPMLMRKN